jgi:hypothetical protein
MKDKKLIYTGLVIFLIVVLFPIWYNLAAGTAAPAPEPKLAKEAQGKQCVLPKEEIRREHMQLLDHWRDTVVRDGRRMWVNPSSGQTFNMSLSNTCLECHSNKKEFCDVCHTWASADPYCWDCHIENPKGEK